MACRRQTCHQSHAIRTAVLWIPCPAVLTAQPIAMLSAVCVIMQDGSEQRCHADSRPLQVDKADCCNTMNLRPLNLPRGSTCCLWYSHGKCAAESLSCSPLAKSIQKLLLASRASRLYTFPSDWPAHRRRRLLQATGLLQKRALIGR